VRAEGEEFRRKYHEAMDILTAWRNIDHADAVAQMLTLQARVTALEATLRRLIATYDQYLLGATDGVPFADAIEDAKALATGAGESNG